MKSFQSRLRGGHQRIPDDRKRRPIWTTSVLTVDLPPIASVLFLAKPASGCAAFCSRWPRGRLSCIFFQNGRNSRCPAAAPPSLTFPSCFIADATPALVFYSLVPLCHKYWHKLYHFVCQTVHRFLSSFCRGGHCGDKGLSGTWWLATGFSAEKSWFLAPWVTPSWVAFPGSHGVASSAVMLLSTVQLAKPCAWGPRCSGSTVRTLWHQAAQSDR